MNSSSSVAYVDYANTISVHGASLLIYVKLLSNNPKDYDIKYWSQIKLDLKKNFSKERFNHLRGVAKVFHAEKIQRLLRERANKK